MKKDLVEFRNIQNNDLPLILKWRNSSKVRNMMRNTKKITKEEHREWFYKTSKNKNQFNKILVYDNNPYGFANFNIDKKDVKVGEWGIYIGNEFAPKGMGKVLGWEMLNFIFEELCMDTIQAKIFTYNFVSLKFHEKMGFRKKCELQCSINGIQKKLSLYELHIDDWRQHKVVLANEIWDKKE